MAVEARRGCGYRKVGGLYLVTSGSGRGCGRLPFPLRTCPYCNAGVKISRGLQFLKAEVLLDGIPECKSPEKCEGCPLSVFGDASIWGSKGIVGLQSIGEIFYKPEEFIFEAQKLGISRRIPHFPKRLKIGETWVFLAHRRAYPDPETGELKPGIFYLFKPERIERVVDENYPQEKRESDLKRGITLVEVPANDKDHH